MKIKHIVLLKCREDVTKAQISEIFEDLKNIKNIIPGITDVSGGTNDSPEGIAREYTHGFILTFADEAVRKIYLPHSEHKKIQVKIARILADVPDNVLVLDYRD